MLAEMWGATLRRMASSFPPCWPHETGTSQRQFYQSELKAGNAGSAGVAACGRSGTPTKVSVNGYGTALRSFI